MTKHTDLEIFGFNEKESLVYMTLLELGSAPMSRIVKKSGLKRTTLYDVLETLKKRGFISITKTYGRTVYLPEDPRIIGEKLDEQQIIFKKTLPELLSIANTFQKKPKIRHYEGQDGLKEIYKDCLEHENQEVLAWTPEELELFDQSFLQNIFTPKRIKNRMWMRVIAPDHPYMREYQMRDTAELRKTLIEEGKKFDLDVEIMLYGNSSVGIVSFTDQMGMVIESKAIFQTLKSIFELQWNSADKK